MDKQRELDNENRRTKIIRHWTPDSKGKVWTVFNDRNTKVTGKPSQNKLTVLGLFAAKYDVVRPLIEFDGVARASEAIATICDYEPEGQDDNL